MIWTLFSAIILKPLEDKIVVEEGKDYFFRFIGESENNYGDSYLGNTFYIVSDFVKNQERYLHLVYLGDFLTKFSKDKEEFLIENTTGSAMKIEDIKSFIFFKFFNISKWVVVVSSILGIILFAGFLYSIFYLIRKRRQRKEKIKSFFKKYSRLDFEDIVINKSYYEKLLKKDLNNLVNFIKKNFFIKEWSDDFINECKKILSNLKK